MQEKTINVRVMLLSYHPVGKTSLMIRYFTDKFVDQWLQTSQIYDRVEIIKLDSGYTINLIISDTPGSVALQHTNLHKFHGIFLMFDVTHSGSFDELEDTIKELHNRVGDKMIVIILGNKADITKGRVVSNQQAQELAQKYGRGMIITGYEYVETSAKTGMNVKQAFERMKKKIYNIRDSIRSSIFLSHNRVSQVVVEKNKQKKPCC